MSRKTRSKESVNTGLKERVKRPPKYNVLLHNDDYTPFAFVIIILLQIFYKTQPQALVITQNAHNEGKAIIGCSLCNSHEVSNSRQSSREL